MKYIILTSSIFYLLGLKFTSNIDLNTKFKTDTVQTKKEIILSPKEMKDELPKEIKGKTDSVAVSPSGSGRFLAPFVVTKVH